MGRARIEPGGKRIIKEHGSTSQQELNRGA
jgi:hypothetical protein